MLAHLAPLRVLTLLQKRLQELAILAYSLLRARLLYEATLRGPLRLHSQTSAWNLSLSHRNPKTKPKSRARVPDALGEHLLDLLAIGTPKPGLHHRVHRRGPRAWGLWGSGLQRSGDALLK